MIKRVRKFLRTIPLIVPNWTLTIVTTECDDACEIISFWIERPCCINHNSACLWHNQFAVLG